MTRFPSPYSNVDQPDTHIGATQPITMRKGLFDGISVAQVVAASAAAATSMLLASKIGIAGSVIGAAVSSMVTVVCSQLYRNALDASAQKLKAKQAYNAYVHAHEERAGGGDAASAGGETIHTARMAPTKLRARAAAERSATKRKVAVASVLIAALAVALSAGAILLSTSGEGLGAKVTSLFAPTDTVPSNTEQPANELAGTDYTGAATPQAPSSTHDGATGSTDEGATSAGSGTESDATGAPNTSQSSEGSGGDGTADQPTGNTDPGQSNTGEHATDGQQGTDANSTGSGQ